MRRASLKPACSFTTELFFLFFVLFLFLFVFVNFAGYFRLLLFVGKLKRHILSSCHLLVGSTQG